MAPAGRVRSGVGGWTYEPWRTTFYPEGLAKARELEYASRQLSAIEINATYYGTQKRESFAKWHATVPDDFVFAVKASRYATNRKVLAEAGESIERFVGSGIAELGGKLGPLLWQFATSKQFDAADFAAFLTMLPDRVEGVPLRHVVEARHPSFMVPEFAAMLRRAGVAAVLADSSEFPSFADVTASFVYARLMRTQSDCDTGYPMADIAAWAERGRCWAAGGQPDDLPRIEPLQTVDAMPRDVYLFYISGAKERAPAAAMATLRALAVAPMQTPRQLAQPAGRSAD